MTVTIKTGDLSSLRNRLKAERKLLEERERAMAIVEQMFLEQQSTNQAQLPLPNMPARRGKISFSDAVREVAQGLTDEFSVRVIEEKLKLMGQALPKNPRPRIAMLVKGLLDAGALELTHRGTGKIPNRYRVKK